MLMYTHVHTHTHTYTKKEIVDNHNYKILNISSAYLGNIKLKKRIQI